MSNKHTEKWMECGNGTLLDPVTKSPLKTDVVELEGFGRIFEVYHYGNDPEGTQRLIESAPELLAALQDCITHDGAVAWRNAEMAGRRLEAISNIARAAIQKATKP